MGYTDLTLKKLFALSGNVCAFPGCDAPVLDTTHGVLTGQICHIKGRSKNGPRYDPNQSEEERNGYENLLVMCSAHNKIVDDEATRDQFPVELLRSIKHAHESRSHNSAVKDDLVERIVARLRPETPAATLTPVVMAMLTKVDHEAGLDYYDFRVELRNDGPKTVREFRIEVEIPRRYMEGTGSFAAEVTSRNPGQTKLFRHTQQNFGREFALYAGDTYPVFQLHYILNKQHYLQGITESIKVFVYSDDEPVSATEYPIAEMLNAERVEMIFAPRREALKKIYEAARNFLGDEGDLTDVTIFLSDEPASGRRSVQLENAYNMAKALAKAGWLWFENEDAMMVRLTDAGIREAS